ncbi:hypothetical protein AeRB84_003765 [Aphanomyces euteiches]|nr:hypothetical protein AeRB84_003765 [Aphanomyces euteiches]
MRNAKYDYVEDAICDEAKEHAWDLTMWTTSTSGSSCPRTSLPLQPQQTQQREEDDAIARPKWTPLYHKPNAVSRSTTSSTRLSSEMMMQLEVARSKPRRQRDAKMHMYDDDHEDNGLDVRKEYERNDEAKYARPYDGHVAKHKRIGELLGMAKPVGPWNQRPQSVPP